MSPITLRQLARRFEQTGELTPPKPERISLDHPQHMLFGATGPPLAVQTVILECLREAAEENIYVSLQSIRTRIYTTIDVDVPRSTLHHWMKKMSLVYGKKKLSGLKAKYARALIRSYILEYSRVKREEERGNCVLVWMDESYIHAGYCSRFSWHTPVDAKVPTKNRVRGCEKGKRLIIIHAMTKDGMLEEFGGDPSDNLEERCASAAIVTNKLSAEGYEPEDYHDTLNGEKFLQWMKNRLIPAFKKKYPRKKMVLILDNAKYHHCRGGDWVCPNKMKKTELGVFLRMAGVKEIKMKDGRVIPAAKFTADARGVAGGGPTVKELKQIVSDYVKSHPGINTTLVEQLMKEHKHELLYTPPYESWLQPIELVWARVKHEVATQSRVGRTWQETADQTKAALKTITKELCEKIIKHTETMMNDWIESSEGGSLKPHKTIHALGRLTKKEREQITDLHLVDTLLTGDVNEEPEADGNDED
jgi:transposase